MDRRDFCKVAAVGSAAMTAGTSLASVRTAGAAHSRKRDFRTMKFGLFVHYVWGGKQSLTSRRDGQKAQDLQHFAAGFDVQAFSDDVARWGVEYVIFTAWHAGINPLFPSTTMQKWGLGSHYCKRDLIGEVIAALRKKGIEVLLYTHPRDGHDLRLEDQRKTGWNGTVGTNPDWSTFDYARWNQFTNELYGELVDRYGKDIIGVYLDEGSALGDSWRVVDYLRLRKTIKSRSEDILMIQNFYGTLYSCDIGDIEYHHWREFENADGKVWPASSKPVGTCFATTWWAEQPQGKNTVKFTAEDMFRYTLLQAGTNTDGGGVQWAAGPYADGGWESGVAETMDKLASYIAPISKSLTNVVASRAFPTREGMTLGSKAWGAPVLEWGVATDAPDGSATYLHVLTPPKGKTLRIGMPADGSRFAGATLLADGRQVELLYDVAGYELKMPDNFQFSEINTTICLKRSI